jgi:hypothetical protein
MTDEQKVHNHTDHRARVDPDFCQPGAGLLHHWLK